MDPFVDNRTRFQRWKDAHWHLFCDDVMFYVVGPLLVLFVYPFLLPYPKFQYRNHVHPPQVSPGSASGAISSSGYAMDRNVDDIIPQDERTKAVVDLTMGLAAECTFPAPERMVWSHEDKVGDRFPLAIPMRSPISGRMIDHACKRMYFEPTTGPLNAVRYVSYHLRDPAGDTPAFFSIDDLREYCHLMQRAPAPEPLYVVDDTDTSSMTLLPNLFRTTADETVRGLYAVVAVESDHEGAVASKGCAPFIREIIAIENDTHLSRLLAGVARGNVRGARPMVVKRADLSFRTDDTCDPLASRRMPSGA